MKTKSVSPDSPTGKMLLKMLEDKKWFNAYLRGEITREELALKGVKVGNPI
jgi:hypothetical protein